MTAFRVWILNNIRQMNVPRAPGIGVNAFRPNVNAGANNGNIGGNAAGNIGRNDGGPIGGGNISGNVGFSKPLNVLNRNGGDAPGASADGFDGGNRRNFDNNNRGDNAGRGNFGSRQLNVTGAGNADNAPDERRYRQ